MSNPKRREFELLEVDADHAKGTAFNMLFAVWRYHTHYEPFRRCQYWLELLSQRHPEGVGTLHVVEATALPPDAPTRRIFVEVMRLPIIQHYSVLHPSRGFKAASVRAVVTSSFALARIRTPHAVHASLAESAHWHAEHMRRIGRSETPEQIASVVEALRRLHVERYPEAAHPP